MLTIEMTREEGSPDEKKSKILIDTERCLLRNWCPEDAVDFYQLNSDPEVLRYTGDAPFGTVDEAKRFIENYRHYQQYGYGRWAVIHRLSGEWMGFCGLRYDPSTYTVDIGFRLKKKYWNQGFATEVALATLEYGHRKLKMNKIIGRCHPDNHASRRILEKIGMQFNHVDQDSHPPWLIFSSVTDTAQ